MRGVALRGQVSAASGRCSATAACTDRDGSKNGGGERDEDDGGLVEEGEVGRDQEVTLSAMRWNARSGKTGRRRELARHAAARLEEDDLIRGVQSITARDT